MIAVRVHVAASSVARRVVGANASIMTTARCATGTHRASGCPLTTQWRCSQRCALFSTTPPGTTSTGTESTKSLLTRATALQLKGGAEDIAQAEIILRDLMSSLTATVKLDHHDDDLEAVVDCGTFLGKILQLQGTLPGSGFLRM